LTLGWQLLLVGWWSGVLVSTCRSVVGRCAATLVFAGWGRKSRMCRKVPQTFGVTPAGVEGRSADEDQACNGGAPTRREQTCAAVTDNRSRTSSGHLSWSSPPPCRAPQTRHQKFA